jgi:hypothetical protein
MKKITLKFALGGTPRTPFAFAAIRQQIMASNKTLAIVRRRADTSTIMETNSKPAPAPGADVDQRVQPDAKVIPFRPRRMSATGGHVPEVDADTAALENLAKYERGDEEDDYRHRMIMNAAALAATIILATAGAWLAITIGDMRKDQDCYLSGRRNCTPIDVPSLQPK